MIAALLVVLVLNAVWGMYQKSEEALARRDKATADLKTLMVREEELRQDITRLSNSDGIEAEIRDRFMVAKAGEKVMIIADPTVAEVHTVTVTDAPTSFLGRMLGAVGFEGGE
jgi:cell division protein FtsB